MLSQGKKLLFLRALVDLAWADRRVEASERDFVLDVARRLGVPEERLGQVEAWLDAPATPTDSELLLEDFLLETLSAAERAELMGLMRELSQVDGEVSDAERRLLEQIERSRTIAETTRRVGSSLKGDGSGAR